MPVPEFDLRYADPFDVGASDGDWRRVAELADLRLVSGAATVLLGDDVVALLRDGGEWFAVDNVCPHQHVSILAEGWVESGIVTCPLHGRMYRLRDGTCVGGGGMLRRWEIKKERGCLWIRYDAQAQPAWMR